MIFRQPALARTLKRIAEQGTDGFYNGDIAERLATAVQKDGGGMNVEDLANYSVEIREEELRFEEGISRYTISLLEDKGQRIFEKHVMGSTQSIQVDAERMVCCSAIQTLGERVPPTLGY